MAIKHVAHIIDDLDGTVLEEGEGGKQMTFSLDGRFYEIDLSERNADRFYAALAPYVNAGRRFTSASGPARKRTASRTRSDIDLNAVRSWARQNGHIVSDRGRVPNSILEAYSAVN